MLLHRLRNILLELLLVRLFGSGVRRLLISRSSGRSGSHSDRKAVVSCHMKRGQERADVLPTRAFSREVAMPQLATEGMRLCIGDAEHPCTESYQ